jgi:hypothetical protein
MAAASLTHAASPAVLPFDHKPETGNDRMNATAMDNDTTPLDLGEVDRTRARARS